MPTALDNPYKFLLANMSGAVIGELTNARNRQLSRPNGAMHTASCQISIRHELALNALNDDLLMKVFRGSLLVFIGPVIGVEETAGSDGQTLQISAANAMWRANKRLLPASRTDAGYIIPGSTAAGNVVTMLTVVNAEAFCGIIDQFTLVP